jgi:hypothetical protein
MNVVALHRKLHDAKPLARRSGEGAAYLEENRLFAQTGQAAGRAQRDVHGLPLVMLGARAVRNVVACPPRTPTCAAVGATPRSKLQLELAMALAGAPTR